MQNAVKLLNAILEIDREGISRAFIQQTLVDASIANTPIELQYTGTDSHAALTLGGVLNGVLHSVLGDNSKRIVHYMRSPVLIDRFALEDTPVFDTEESEETPK